MFKLIRKTMNGIFKVSFNRDLSNQEIDGIVKLSNLLFESKTNISSRSDNVSSSSDDDDDFFPDAQQTPSLKERMSITNEQKFVAQNPINHINLGTYHPPTKGVRLRMFSLLQHKSGRVQLIRFIRELTGISVAGIIEILMGNYPCPILTLENAEKIHCELRSMGVFAKIVDGEYRPGV